MSGKGSIEALTHLQCNRFVPYSVQFEWKLLVRIQFTGVDQIYVIGHQEIAFKGNKLLQIKNKNI